ncbi:MAG: tyrosine-type recombinase/integrase [Alphaproteobacteria bacterium]|nr:tyrosine-type recombinase/integrase [Alphaproteobacteria bacterium]
MPNSRNTVKRRLKDGSVKTYVYDRKPKGKPPAANTVGWLRRIYLAGPDFAALAPSTQKYYKIMLHYLDGVRHMPVQDVEMGHIAHIRDRLAADRPGMANLFVGVCSALFKWARLRGHRKGDNPAHGIPKLQLGERGAWPDSALLKAESEMQGPIRLAFMLALHTGQRQGDVIGMTWSQFDGQGISLRQGKTGVDLYIPATPALKAALEAAREGRGAVQIVAGPKGAYSLQGFRYAWDCEMKRIGMHGQGLLFHGLRHTALTRLAEAGCSEREIMAISGHKSPTTVSRYVRLANQRTMAEAAIVKLADAKRAKDSASN